MIYAFVRQESAFKADARSPAGAVGLMQMMPATARSVARMERRGWLKNARAVMDPGVSLSLGQRYISYLLEGRELMEIFFLRRLLTMPDRET